MNEEIEKLEEEIKKQKSILKDLEKKKEKLINKLRIPEDLVGSYVKSSRATTIYLKVREATMTSYGIIVKGPGVTISSLQKTYIICNNNVSENYTKISEEEFMKVWNEAMEACKKDI